MLTDTEFSLSLYYCRKTTTYSVSKGLDFSLQVKKEATDITTDMLLS